MMLSSSFLLPENNPLARDAYDQLFMMLL
jgi:hypothetical protein